MNITLKEYQKTAQTILDIVGGNCINGMPTGTGKTITSLYWCVRHNINAIIVCPSNLKENWESELINNFDIKPFVIKKKTDFKVLSDSRFIICSYNMACWLYKIKKIKDKVLRSGKYTCLICDESSYLGSGTTKRTIAIQTISKYVLHKMFLSATPLQSQITQIYTQIKIINPYLFFDKSDFILKLGLRTDRFGNIKQPSIESINRLKKILGNIYFTFDKNKILPELPAKIRSILYYDIDKNSYKSILEEANLKETILEKILYMKQQLSLLMVDNVVEQAKYLLQNSTKKVIIYTAYKQTCTEINKKLQNESVIYNGDISIKNRKSIKDNFVEYDDKRVLIATIQSMAFGVDRLQYAANTVLFCDVTYVPFELFQAEDRVYRIGSVKDIIVYYFSFRDTYHEKLFSILRNKWWIHDSLFGNGERSLDYDVFSEIIGG